MIIIILAKHKCEIKIDVVGNYILTLESVQGFFNPIILKKGDWIRFGDGTMIEVPERVVNIFDIGNLNVHLSDLYREREGENINRDEEFHTNSTTCITQFPQTIIDCSNRFKQIYEIESLPCTKSYNLAHTNGPMFLLVKCEGIPTEMRFSNQITGEDKYSAIITKVVSININQFSIGFPFTLVGNSFQVTDAMLKNIQFKIVDIFNEEIEFINNLIWTFSLQKVEE
jgi:hypothetical protein